MDENESITGYSEDENDDYEEEKVEEYDEGEAIDEIEYEIDELGNNSRVILSLEETYNHYYKDKKKTKPIMTKFEKAKILGIRSEMLSSGALSTIDLPKNIDNSYDIAKMELEQKKVPLIVRRYLPDGSIEDWRVSELI